MRLVIDTNTVVSGLLWNNAPFHLIQAALRGRVDLFTSRALLLELEDVLPRRKFAHLIVSGDAHLLNLKTFQRIPIITAAEAVTRIAQSSRG